MIEPWWAWRSVGFVESLLLLLVIPLGVAGLPLGRFPRLDAGLAMVGSALLVVLGATASHQRLAAVAPTLETLPERQLIGAIAQAEAEAFGVFGGALCLAALLGAAWAWRTTPPSDGPTTVRPSAVLGFTTLLLWAAAAQLPPALPSPGGLLGPLLVSTFALLLASGLRPGDRWLAPALATLLGVGLCIHGGLLRALVLDPPPGESLSTLFVLRNLSLVAAGVGTLFSFPRRWGTAAPLVAMFGAAAAPGSQLPEQWGRHPAPLPVHSSFDHPGVEPTRLFGGCLVGPDGEESAVRLRSTFHGAEGCSPGSKRTYALDPGMPLIDLPVAEVAELGMQTRIDGSAFAPAALAGWFDARWSVPLWRLNPGPRPVPGSLVVGLGSERFVTGPNGPTNLASALAEPGRRELLIVLREGGTVEELVAFCREAYTLRPEGTRCGLALGDGEAWRLWATSAARSIDF